MRNEQNTDNLQGLCAECVEAGVLEAISDACSDECYDALPNHVKKIWEKRERQEARHYRDFLFQL